MLTNKFSICNRYIDSDKNFFSNANIDNLRLIPLKEDLNARFVYKNIDKSTFSPLRVNAGSLSKTLDQLVLYLNDLTHSFSGIAISETRATSVDR